MNKPRFVLLAVALILGLSQTAFAQFSGGTGQLPTLPQMPNNGGIQGGNLTPDQLRNIMALRALQARGMGRGQVRTGVPQFIPFGSGNINGGGINNGSFGMPDQSQQQSGSTRKSSSQKRAEARAAREEEKKAKAEAAKEKKAQNAQANADPDPKSKASAKSKSKSKAKSTSAKSTAAKSKSKSKSAAKSTSSKKSKSDESADENSDPADE